jgi:DNA-binding HxlR family transcriptional regulator
MDTQERTISTAAHLQVSDHTAAAERVAVLSSDDPRCAARVVLDRVADKWTVLVIAILTAGPIGYADIRRSTPGISDKMLAQTLRRLERDGLVERTVHPGRSGSVTR